VTSGTRLLATTRLEAIGLMLPRALVTAEQVGLGKPHPEGYVKAAMLLGVPPRDCLVIEDAPAASSRAIGVTNTFSAAELAEADMVVPELSHLQLTVTETGPLSPPLLTLVVS
jgi:sugar-phosphatase